MKAFFAVFLLAAVVAVNATLDVEQLSKLQELHNLHEQVQLHKAQLLERLYQPAPFEQTESINAALLALQTANANGNCASGMEAVLEQYYNDRQMCRATAHKEVEEIILDIGVILDMIIMDAYELTLMYKECAAKENDVDKGFCFTRWAFEIVNCIDELRLAIRDMIDSSNEQADALLLQNEMCNNEAVNGAVMQFHHLQRACEAN